MTNKITKIWLGNNKTNKFNSSNFNNNSSNNIEWIINSSKLAKSHKSNNNNNIIIIATTIIIMTTINMDKIMGIISVIPPNKNKKKKYHLGLNLSLIMELIKICNKIISIIWEKIISNNNNTMQTKIIWTQILITFTLIFNTKMIETINN